MINKLKEYIPYLIGLAAIACIVFYPELQGKKLRSHDSVSAITSSAEYNLYKKNGENILWTNRVFSGMPTYTIAGDVSGNFLIHGIYLPTKFIPFNLAIYFIILSCFFLGLLLLRIEPRISFLFAAAAGLNVWILDSLWAFHVTKILTYAFLFIVISGFISYIWYGGWVRLVFMTIGLTICIGCNHVQIVYYGAILCILLGIFFLIDAILKKSVSHFLKKALALIICVTLSVTSNISLLYILQDYNKDTMRGGKTELVKNEANSTSSKGGLDINYAFSWSYNSQELLNFFIPNASGGSSNYKTNAKKSKLSEAIGESQEKLPFYWGGQPFTGGPNYFGAAVLFFFILSIFYWRNKILYVFITAFFLSIFMGLGKYFMDFNEFLFNNLPLYNKFRTPTMSFSILNITVILVAGLGLNHFLSSEDKNEEKLNALKKTAYFLLGLMILAFIYTTNTGFSNESDTQSFGNNAQMLNLIIEDRTSLFKTDWIRTMFIFILSALGIFFYIKNSFSKRNLIFLLSIITIFEMWNASNRYLNTDEFAEAGNEEELIPSASYNADLEKDKSHFRIFNTTNQSVFNDNIDGYRFSNVGGYSPAKLYRYQDLIDVHLSKGNMSVLNMLNTKYLIVEYNGQQIAQQNPNACGNAWFVKQVKFAQNANEEIDSIGTADTRSTAWIDNRYNKSTDYTINTDPNAKIELTKYHPEKMQYTSNSSSGGYVVFSEIWYRGNEDWKLYVDGKPETLVRTNYILRGAHIPAGNHKLEMIFKPEKLETYILISRIATIIQILGLIFAFYLVLKKRENA